MTALNLSISTPPGIQQQYMLSATMCYHRHEQRINIPPRRLSSNQEGAQMVKNQTILLVRGVYRRLISDTTTTNFLKELAIDP